MNNCRTPVRFPQGAHDTGDDLSAPVVQLLQDLHILASDDDSKKAGTAQSALTGPPQSVAIIEAGATAVTKGWSVAIALLGGAPALLVVFRGLWGGEHDAVRIAFVAGGALVLAAIAVSIGIISSGDVQARAVGSVAEYQARAEIASTFLQLSRLPQASPPPSANGPLSGELRGLRGRIVGGGGYEPITEVRYDPAAGGQPLLKVGKDWVSYDRVEISRAGS